LPKYEKQITQEQKYTISCVLEKGFRLTEIAKLLININLL